MSERELGVILTCEKGLVDNQIVHVGPDNTYIPDKNLVGAALKVANLCDSCPEVCELGKILNYVQNSLTPKGKKT